MNRQSATSWLPATRAALIGPLVAASLAAGALVALPQLGHAAQGIILGVPLVIGTLWLTGNPRLLCFWGLILTAPISLAKRFVPVPHMGGAGAYSIEVGDLFLLALIVFIVRDFRAGRLHDIRFPATARWWLALTLLGIVSLIEGPYHTLAAEQIFEELKELIFFLVLVHELVRVRQFVQVATAIAVSVLFQSLIGYAEYIHHGALGLQMLGEATDIDYRYAADATYTDVSSSTFRIGALLGHPNLFAAFLALMLPIVLTALLTPIDGWRRTLLGVALVAGLGALMLTLSRTGWFDFGLGFTVLFGFAAVHPRIRGRYVRLRLAITGIVVTGVLLALPQIVRRFTASDPGALNFRYEWMDVAWAMVREHPLFGIGLNTFVFHLPNATQYGDVAGLTDHFGPVWPIVHNTFLIIWSEQGTIGFFLFVMVYVSLLDTGLRNTRRLLDDRLYMLNLGCIAGLMATVIDGLGSFFLRNAQCARCFWLVAAILVAIRYWQRANSRRALPLSAPPRAAASRSVEP